MSTRSVRHFGSEALLFLIDATQSAGVMALDVQRLDPDFVIFPTYKWLVGPYGRAFLYVAKRHQNGIPLEQTSAGRRNVRAENAVYFTDLDYVPDARRFDMGERDHFISMEMASIGMEMMADWGAAAIAQRLAMLTERIAAGVRGIGVRVPEPHLRAPHILSLAFKGGMPAGLVEGLASEGVYVAPRLGRMRVSPHVYNDEADADRFVEVLTRRLRSLTCRVGKAQRCPPFMLGPMMVGTLRFAHPTEASGRRHLPRLLRARHHKPLIPLGRDVVADLPVRADATDIGHENPRLARERWRPCTRNWPSDRAWCRRPR